MGSCCSAIALFTFHIYLGIFLAQGGSRPRLEWETMLVLQQKRLKSLNLNQTLDMAPPLPFFATVRQVMQARCWVSRLSPSMYALFVCLGLDFCALWVYLWTRSIRMPGTELFGTLAHVYGIWTFYLAKETQMSQQDVITFHFISLECRHKKCFAGGHCVCQLRMPGQGSIQMFKGLYLHAFLFASGLSFQKEASCWSWSQNRKCCHGTTLTHTGVSHSSPRRAVATEAKLPSVHGSTVRARVCVCLSSPQASPHASVSVCCPKSVQNCWQVPIPLSGKPLHAYTVAWSPSCCARLASLKMWQVFSLLSATNAICGASP